MLHFITLTDTHTHIYGRTPLDEWSARSRDFYLTTHITHKRHPCPHLGGIQNRHPSKSAASNPRLRPHGQWDRLNYWSFEVLMTQLFVKYFIKTTISNIILRTFMYILYSTILKIKPTNTRYWGVNPNYNLPATCSGPSRNTDYKGTLQSYTVACSGKWRLHT